MWPFSKIRKLEEDKKVLKEQLEIYEQALSEERDDKNIMSAKYEKLLSQEFTFRDVEYIFEARLKFLDDKIKEFENHNVPELASHVFIRKQELTDTLCAIEAVCENKEEIKQKMIEKEIKRQFKMNSVV